MSMEPHRPQGYPTDELPTYRKVSTHPEPSPEPADPTGSQQSSWSGTGELPVTGRPVSTPAAVIRPRGPHLPTVLSGVMILLLAALVVVWRVLDNPDWAIVGISFGLAAGVVLVLSGVIGFVVHHARADRDFDRMLSGS
ncbi:hypothetical protein GCM10011492_43000 [Flexivirga endophytica]|uniref:Uncharacterized protein n=1 Tax=Flexivirga endophytica TaxID=1849103 RepID=A0A916TK41_9MICO|nr:hypothetical protein [Flexivirga endophytica]GGB47239.1 hypothetical protein GCM10011492_43000 [Flexivirga endophytica]GHB67278.1 hypothetical protein GCM10008112_40170 [Flexivirga endophytica]